MTEIITSTRNTQVKLVVDLQKRARVRREKRLIVLEGERLIRDAWQQQEKPTVVYYTHEVDFTLIAELSTSPIAIQQVTPEVIQHMSDTVHSPGMLAIFEMPMPTIPKEPKRIVILDAIREPGNMGTILRTAAAANVELIILAACVDPYNPKVLRAGMGAHFRIPIVEAGWMEIKQFCADHTTYLTTGKAEQVYTSVDWTQDWAIIIGNEAHGGGDEASQLADQQIFIPMEGGSESLNAAVATGVILFEAQRQRLTSS